MPHVRCVPTTNDAKADTETPMSLMITVRLAEWLLATQQTQWEVHEKKRKLIMAAAGEQAPPKLIPCIGWCLKACQLKMGDMDTDISPLKPIITTDGITLLWIKHRLEIKIRAAISPTQTMQPEAPPYQAP